jgi:hypothetical protein
MPSGEEMERDERYDSIIDRALQSYAEPVEVPETRVVLARVMERVRASESRRRGWWMWGAAAAAGLAVMVLVWMMREPRPAEIAWVPKGPGVAVIGAAQSAALPDQAGEEKRSVPQGLKPEVFDRTYGTAEAVPLQKGGKMQRESRGEAESMPKKEVFPTPRPLSEQEQALVSFARRAPAAVKKAVIEDQQHWDDPVIVADLRKPSLESGSQQDY